MFVRLQRPCGVSLSYVLKVVVAVSVSLLLVEIALRNLEWGDVHVYNLGHYADDFFKFHEPCYPAFQQDRFKFLRHSLGSFKKAAHDVGLSWWLEFGTMLGAVRAARFIPWDHDMDLAVYKDDLEPKMEQFKAALRRHNLDILAQKTGCKFLITKYNATTGEHSEEYRFDLFMFATTTPFQTAAFYRQFRNLRQSDLTSRPAGLDLKAGTELVTRCGLPDWYRYTTPRRYLDDLVEIPFEGSTGNVPREAKLVLRMFRYPYSYWVKLPYKINCYLFEREYIWVTLVLVAVVAVLCMCCLTCRRQYRLRATRSGAFQPGR